MKPIVASLIVTIGLAGSALAQAVPPNVGEPNPAERAATRDVGKGDLQSGGELGPGSSAAERRAERLDSMFARLADATSKRRADRIARHIMRRMSRSGSETVNVLMTQAGVAMRTKRYGVALDLLDGVVRLEPSFAEGWNRRATVHYMAGDFSASLADIEQVLRREPRHWGALAGLSMILVSMDRKEAAVEIMDKALAVHPYLNEMKERRDQLLEELDGAST